MKKILIIYFGLLSFLVCNTASAFERESMYETAKRILQLSQNQGDYSSYSQMMEMYQDFRGKVKADLKLGNPNTAVDYELLVEGLILENYQVLQSVLGFNNYHDTTKEFSSELDHTYTQKLAYALKQNKIAFQTHFEVKKSVEQDSCTIMLNGKELKQLSFLGPAGVPFYIGIYCQNKMFEVKKIQAAEAQKLYTISFSNLKKAIYRDDPVDMGVPNPNLVSGKKIVTPKSKRLGLFEAKDVYISTGVGVDWFLNEANEEYYQYPQTKNSALLLYSSTQFIYKNFEFVFDIGPVTKQTPQFSEGSLLIKTQNTTFVRPALAYTEIFYNYKNIFVMGFDVGMSVFLTGSDDAFLTPTAYGVKGGVLPKLYLWSPLFIGGDLGLTYNFAGSQKSMLLNTSLLLGVDF